MKGLFVFEFPSYWNNTSPLSLYCIIAIIMSVCVTRPMPGFRGGGGGGGLGVQTPPPKNYKALEFLRNSSPNPMKPHKTTKPAFNDGPSPARQGNAI